MQIPEEVKSVVKKLQKAGFEAFIVGGCVRDLLRKVKPEDWDVVSDAKPEQIRRIFPRSFIENKFGTVTILTDSDDETLKEIEITPYRIEAQYSDKRHPDEIKWAKNIEEDLARRDFTVNALAVGLKSQIPSTKSQTNSKFKILNSKPALIDLFAGQKDLKDKIIRAVRKPEERFSEDALRLIRAVRFAITLGKGWEIEKETEKAIQKNAHFLEMISKERIRDELMKIIMSERAAEGIELLRKLKLLKHIIPELEEGYKVSQNKHHIYDCYEHSLRSLDYAAREGYNKFVRIAALFHDIGKPGTKNGKGPEATFYGHEVVGAKITAQILNRLKYPKKDSGKIVKLVRYHLFYYNVGEVSESSVRRLLRKVGPENIEELLQVRYADRIGSGCPKAEPYKLRHLKYLLEKVSRDPISVKMLKVSGHDVMNILKIGPGPKVGQILDVLLGEILEHPQKNESQYLENKVEELGKLKEKELKTLAQKTKKERENIETKKDEMTKKKYWVT